MNTIYFVGIDILEIHILARTHMLIIVHFSVTKSNDHCYSFLGLTLALSWTPIIQPPPITPHLLHTLHTHTLEVFILMYCQVMFRCVGV